MKINLSELEQKAKAATPGPWIFNSYSSIFTSIHDDPLFTHCDIVAGDTTSMQGREDCIFVASMNPTTALALIRVARAAEQIYNLLPWDFGHCTSVKKLEDALKEIE